MLPQKGISLSLFRWCFCWCGVHKRNWSRTLERILLWIFCLAVLTTNVDYKVREATRSILIAYKMRLTVTESRPFPHHQSKFSNTIRVFWVKGHENGKMAASLKKVGQNITWFYEFSMILINIQVLGSLFTPRSTWFNWCFSQKRSFSLNNMEVNTQIVKSRKPEVSLTTCQHCGWSI